MAPRCQGPYHCPGCTHCAVEHRPLTPADEARIQRALRHDPPIYGPRPLRLVQAEQGTTSYTAPDACDASYGCLCPRCQQQRAVLIQHGPKKVKQPWQIREAA